MNITVETELERRFPSLMVVFSEIRDVNVTDSGEEFKTFSVNVLSNARKKYDKDTIANQDKIKIYRDFYWKNDIDPTKIRPASEALIRRILDGEDISGINNVVDAYNLASIDTLIPMCVYDSDKIKGDLVIRFAKPGEEFRMLDRPTILKENQIIVSDEEKVICLYPYRDADATKVDYDTKNVLFLADGVPGITPLELLSAMKVGLRYITRFAGGKVFVNL